MSALREDNHRLTAQVTELRGENHAQDRKVRDLERQLDLVRAKLVTSVMDSVPSLPVQVVTPPAGAVAPTGDPTSRVVAVTDDGEEIIYEGDAAAGRMATLDDVSNSDDPAPARVRTPAPRVVTTPTAAARLAPRPPRTTTIEAASDRSADAANEYRAAVELVKGGDSTAAIAALRAFISAHPHHDYADNAQYWLGEAYYAQREFQQALSEFRTVIEVYPRGNKVPDALLKVGFCYQAMGQTQKAQAVLEQVVNLYPKSEPAAIAAKRLETP